MIRLPNKLYAFGESILALFPTIMAALTDEPKTVLELCENLRSAILETTDYIDARALLLTINAIELGPNTRMVSHAN